ncbi:hypothetical protein QBC35DRAFT_495051 [Podospora australis]|uniref:Uncharacterized protein n=1 Tax=Podospora australis TaxID=1536484 RepID=A0AAN7AKJ2_9PEZI|nr:hypothetical protein QBC35DRAFT_495051 [Podospora australis]
MNAAVPVKAEQRRAPSKIPLHFSLPVRSRLFASKNSNTMVHATKSSTPPLRTRTTTVAISTTSQTKRSDTMGSLKRAHDGDHQTTPTPRTSGTHLTNGGGIKKARIEAVDSEASQQVTMSSPVRLLSFPKTETTSSSRQNARNRPSTIMGISNVASLIPIQECRHVLTDLLSDREARMLLTHLIHSKPRRRTTQYLSSRYDELFAPRADQIVAFDEMVAAIKTAFRSCLSLETISPAELESVMTLHGVQSNIRAIHASAVWPASLGTRLNALKALLEINQFLIRSSLLRDPKHREVVQRECPTLGVAVLDICQGLTGPEKVIALGMHFPNDAGMPSSHVAQQPQNHQSMSTTSSQQQRAAAITSASQNDAQGHGQSQSRAVRSSRNDTLEVELREQAKIFDKLGFFRGVVQAYQLLVESKRSTGTAVQAVPISGAAVDEEEENETDDEEEYHEGEDGYVDELPLPEDEILESQD